MSPIRSVHTSKQPPDTYFERGTQFQGQIDPGTSGFGAMSASKSVSGQELQQPHESVGMSSAYQQEVGRETCNGTPFANTGLYSPYVHNNTPPPHSSGQIAAEISQALQQVLTPMRQQLQDLSMDLEDLRQLKQGSPNEAHVIINQHESTEQRSNSPTPSEAGSSINSSVNSALITDAMRAHTDGIVKALHQRDIHSDIKPPKAIPWDGQFITLKYKEVLRAVHAYDRETTGRLGFSLLNPDMRPPEGTLTSEQTSVFDKASGALLTFLSESVRGHKDAVVQSNDLDTQLYRGYIAFDRLFKWKPGTVTDAQTADSALQALSVCTYGDHTQSVVGLMQDLENHCSILSNSKDEDYPAPSQRKKAQILMQALRHSEQWSLWLDVKGYPPGVKYEAIEEDIVTRVRSQTAHSARTKRAQELQDKLEGKLSKEAGSTVQPQNPTINTSLSKRQRDAVRGLRKVDPAAANDLETKMVASLQVSEGAGPSSPGGGAPSDGGDQHHTGADGTVSQFKGAKVQRAKAPRVAKVVTTNHLQIMCAHSAAR